MFPGVPRLPRAVAALLLASLVLVSFALASFGFASCAAPNASSLGGGGGGGATTTLPSLGGSGGSPLGNGGSPPFVDAGACSAFAETFMPACLACLAASCCDVALACAAVPDCLGVASCQQNCPPATSTLDGGGNGCLAACAQNFPMAQPAFGTMTACLHASCAGTCPY